MQQRYNILIIGGGIIGSSIAMALSESGGRDIGVVDVDLSGKWGSSERNAGGVRAAWAQPVNIRLSRKSIAYYEQVASEVGFHQKGYLWLYDGDGWSQAADRITLQKKLGCPVEQLKPLEIKRRYPFLDRLEDVFAATFSPEDGLINPNLLKHHYRRRALAAGVDWIDHQMVDEVTIEGGRAVSVRLRKASSEDDVKLFLTGEKPPSPRKTSVIKVKTLVNAAGSWAPPLARLYGGDIPSIPVRRQVAVVHCQDVDLAPYGMIVDTNGLYFHHEAGNILSGYALSSELPGYRFEYGENFFMEEIWPRLSARSSRFDRLKEVGGWAGLYAVSPDKSAIIGPVEGIANLFEAHSFSGRGVMHSYAAGQALAELILREGYQTIDLSILSGGRFKKGNLVPEETHI